MFDKDSLEYLVGLGENEVVDFGGKQYSTRKLYPVNNPIPCSLNTTTLTALVDYLKSDMDKTADKLLVHVVSPTLVLLLSELRDDEEREGYIKCEALLPHIPYGNFLSTEQFNIMLQSSFVDNNDKGVLLKYTGLVRDEAVKDTGDDGVSQKVTIKTGIASVGEAVVPNPVILAPYRTFPEIEQPESRFIFRMQDGPRAALFEADGGAWRNEAMNRIKKYLDEQLKGLNNVQIIS